MFSEVCFKAPTGILLKRILFEIYLSVNLRFTCFNFISYILWFTLFSSFPRSGATALDGEIRFHRFFWPHLKDGFLVVFSIWRGIPISLFMPIMSTSIVVKTV